METLNILVVEDGQSQREMLQEFLAGEGHRVVGAEDGDTAVRQVREDHFDLLLLDFKMPGMNGIEVLKEIKKINPQINVVGAADPHSGKRDPPKETLEERDIHGADHL